MHKKYSYRTCAIDMAVVSTCAAMIVISAYLTIPFAVGFTLQTLAIFLISALFDLKRSLGAVLLYITLGICGLPVFSGFSAGFAALLGPSGGFIVGFILIPPIIHAFTPHTNLRLTISMLVALAACYVCGALWYIATCSQFTSGGILSSLLVCVLPFILPDLAKIGLAVFLTSRLKPHIKI